MNQKESNLTMQINSIDNHMGSMKTESCSYEQQQLCKSNSGAAQRQNLKSMSYITSSLGNLSSLSHKCRQRKDHRFRRRTRFTSLTSSVGFLMMLVWTTTMIITIVKVDIFANAANDDGYNDDALAGDDYYYDDYYGALDDYNAVVDDAYVDKYSAVDDASNLDDEVFEEDDDYVNYFQDGAFGFDEVTFMPISCIQ